ncbi:hypothetical protein QG37_02739 [Candidozyma auris]|nr:hypothetical protein QG37_02739 [[Candida] auris]
MKSGEGNFQYILISMSETSYIICAVNSKFMEKKEIFKLCTLSKHFMCGSCAARYGAAVCLPLDGSSALVEKR